MTKYSINELDIQLLDIAIKEDLGKELQDATYEQLFAKKKSSPSQALIISKHPTPITLCGASIATYLANIKPFNCTIEPHFQDGEQVAAGGGIVTITGEMGNIIKLERLMLNVMRHLSAIATLTQQFTDKINHFHTQILDTRKTTPGLRHLEKYAVQCGGGANHRMGLYDAIMVKDTHIDMLGGILATMQTLPDKEQHHFPVIVEVRDIAELQVVLNFHHKVDRILLDNMSLESLKQSVDYCQQKQVATEASGNISLETIESIAACGVDFASVGQLTYSAGNVDLSLIIN